jgi:hypothetical protein
VSTRWSSSLRTLASFVSYGSTTTVGTGGGTEAHAADRRSHDHNKVERRIERKC